MDNQQLLSVILGIILGNQLLIYYRLGKLEGKIAKIEEKVKFIVQHLYNNNYEHQGNNK